VQGHFDEAERRMQNLMATVVDASSDVQEALREAYVRFYGATGAINTSLAQWVAQSRPTISRIDCEDNFEACVLQVGEGKAGSAAGPG
jgi:hypothetical protein